VRTIARSAGREIREDELTRVAFPTTDSTPIDSSFCNPPVAMAHEQMRAMASALSSYIRSQSKL
jgi:hypothetical protein